MSKRVFFRVVLCLAPVVWACDIGGPSYPDISGTWAYSASNLANVVSSHAEGFCNTSNITLVLVQTEGTFSGSYGYGGMDCWVGSWIPPQLFSGGPVVNGVVTESGDLAFDFDTPDFHFHMSGALNGRSMSGSAVVKMGPVGDQTILVGNWAASH